MKASQLWILTLVMICVSLGAYRFLKPKETRLSSDILKRSEAYIQTLGQQPLESLKTEDKLLLLHAYYNVHNYAKTAQLGGLLKPQIERLPAERRAVFTKMIEEAAAKA